MKATASTLEWLGDYYRALEGMRFDEVAEYLTADVVSHYPTGTQIVGREALIAASEKALGRLERLRHEILNVWEEGAEVIFELEVTYWRKDGETIVRPGVGIFVREGRRIREQRLFVDASGVWD